MNMKYIKYLVIIISVITLNAYGKDIISLFNNTEKESLLDNITAPPDTSRFTITDDNPILQALDSLVNAPYFTLCASCDENSKNYSSTADTNYPKFDEKVYKERLAILNKNTPFKLVFNNEVKGFIDLYANRRRLTTAKVLGLSDMYFPIFEEMLDKHNLPLEFKYLAIVESALNPTAKSKAGAVGLWQFMLTTGKIYGLDVTSFEDERSDPYLATEAACMYFKYLYDIYNDWELVLAAYNCGPGNVNKAIRRSGYKKNYWELWPYLPKETRGYVPAFIAVNYVMNYAKEHKIDPIKPITAYFDYDTLKINQRLDLKILSEKLNISYDLLHILNPSYKLGIVPETGKHNNLYLPVSKIGMYLENEKLIYALSSEKKYNTTPVSTALVALTHFVQSRESITQIASRYNTSRDKIIEWNSMKDTTLQIQQKLVVGYVEEEVSKPETTAKKKI